LMFTGDSAILGNSDTEAIDILHDIACVASPYGLKINVDKIKILITMGQRSMGTQILQFPSAMQYLRHCKGFAHVSFLTASRKLKSPIPAVSAWSGFVALRSGSSSQDHHYSRFKGSKFRYAITGLVVGTGAVLAYGVHHNK
ncbi:sulfite oxidase, mitochondrial, partial [Clarias magur]